MLEGEMNSVTQEEKRRGDFWALSVQQVRPRAEVRCSTWALRQVDEIHEICSKSKEMGEVGTWKGLQWSGKY